MSRFVAAMLALGSSSCGCFVPVDELPPDERSGMSGVSDGGGGEVFVDAGPRTAATLPARLPEGLHGAAAAFDGRFVWIFGGLTASGIFSDGVLRFDPRTETIQTTAFKLPYGRQASSAVYLGGFVYLFGGRSTMTTLITDIVQFEPATGLMRPMNAVLPSARYNMGAVAISGRIFVFGGYDYSKVRDIVSYDPGTDTLAVPNALSPGRESPVAVASSNEVFLLGGSDTAGQLTEIVRYETSSNEVRLVTSRLPYAAWQPAPFVIDGKGYLYGGEGVRTIIEFDPASGQAVTLAGVTTVDPPAMSSCTASLPGRAYVFGGYGPNGEILDRIVRFVP